jgi:hypothetical protein
MYTINLHWLGWWEWVKSAFYWRMKSEHEVDNICCYHQSENFEMAIGTTYTLMRLGILMFYNCYAHTSPGAHPASNAVGTGSFPRVKPQGCDVDHPPHLAPRSKKERVELYLYSTSGPSWPVAGWTLPLLLLYNCNATYELRSCKILKIEQTQPLSANAYILIRT